MFYIVDIGLDGMKSAMANIGLKMIMQKGDIVMASQVMEMDTVEGMLIVKQKNFFCSVGFRSGVQGDWLNIRRPLGTGRISCSTTTRPTRTY